MWTMHETARTFHKEVGYLSRLASRSASIRVKVSPTRKGPITFRLKIRLGSSTS